MVDVLDARGCFIVEQRRAMIGLREIGSPPLGAPRLAHGGLFILRFDVRTALTYAK